MTIWNEGQHLWKASRFHFRLTPDRCECDGWNGYTPSDALLDPQIRKGKALVLCKGVCLSGAGTENTDGSKAHRGYGKHVECHCSSFVAQCLVDDLQEWPS
jgi:hypothetical protein